MIIRGGQVLILPACLATPEELSRGVTDIEALCGRAAGAYLQRRPGAYRDERERRELISELVSYLMLAAWVEASKFDGRGQLDRYLGQRLQWRCTDWYRSYFGRGKTPRPRPVPVSLDALREQEQLEPDVA